MKEEMTRRDLGKLLIATPFAIKTFLREEIGTPEEVKVQEPKSYETLAQEVSEAMNASNNRVIYYHKGTPGQRPYSTFTPETITNGTVPYKKLEEILRRHYSLDGLAPETNNPKGSGYLMVWEEKEPHEPEVTIKTTNKPYTPL